MEILRIVFIVDCIPGIRDNLFIIVLVSYIIAIPMLLLLIAARWHSGWYSFRLQYYFQIFANLRFKLMLYQIIQLLFIRIKYLSQILLEEHEFILELTLKAMLSIDWVSLEESNYGLMMYRCDKAVLHKHFEVILFLYEILLLINYQIISCFIWILLLTRIRYHFLFLAGRRDHFE